MWLRGFGFLSLDSWVWIPGFGFQDLDSLLKIPDIGVQTVGKPYPRIHLDSRIASANPGGFADSRLCLDADSRVWVSGLGFMDLDSLVLIPGFGFMS